MPRELTSYEEDDARKDLITNIAQLSDWIGQTSARFGWAAELGDSPLVRDTVDPVVIWRLRRKAIKLDFQAREALARLQRALYMAEKRKEDEITKLAMDANPEIQALREAYLRATSTPNTTQAQARRERQGIREREREQRT